MFLFVIKLLVFVVFSFASAICSNSSNVFEGSKWCNVTAKYYYDYDEFFALSDFHDSQPAGYYVKLPISVHSQYGTTYIVLCETDALIDNNRCYEFALGIWNNSRTEIRRKDNVHELFHYVKCEFATYTVERDTKVFIELSVSDDGMIKLLDLNTQFETHMTDTTDVIPVKYIAFASFLGFETLFTFNCSDVFHSEDVESSDKKTDVFSRAFPLLSTWTKYIITVIASCQLYSRMFNILT